MINYTLAATLAFCLSAVTAQAQTFTVKKVKGRQAVVQMQSGSFSEGQSVTVGDSTGGSSFSASTGNRGKFLGLEGQLSSSKPAGSTNQVTGLSIEMLYGWNKTKMEYGVLGLLGTTSGGTANTTTFGFGGKFDYNLIDNRAGTDLIYGVGGEATYAMKSGGGDLTTITIFPYFTAKWFLLGNSTAIRVDAGLAMNQYSGGGSNSSDSGVRATVGLFQYF